MTTALRLLAIEDSEDDALLILHELRRGGYAPTWERVDTPSALSAALERQSWDVITCDWVMPAFSAPAALALLQARGVDVPIIVVSGEVGEEVAVTAMKAGAHDVVSKNQLARLCPAIERELREAAVRRAHTRALIALHESEDRYRDLVEHSQDLICTHDLEGRILSMNPAPARALGYEPNELVGTNLRDGLAPEVRDQFDAYLARVRRDGIATGLMIVLTKSGERRVWDFTNTLRTAGVAEPIVRGMAHDVTERTQAVTALHTLTAQQAAILDALPANLALLDGRGTILTVNAAWKRFASANALPDAACAVGTNYVDVCERAHGDDADEAHAAARGIRAVLCGELADYAIEYPCHSPGEQRWFRLMVTPLVAGRREGALVMHVDVTERVLADQAVRASEMRYRRLFETAKDGIVILNAESGRITDVNPFLVELLGYGRNEFVGRRLWEVEGLLADAGAAAQELRALRAREYVRYDQLALRAKDGRRIDVEFTSSVYRLDGTPVVQCNVRDITDRKRAEEARLQTEEQHRLLIQNLRAGVIVHAPDTAILLSNPEAARLLRLSPEQLLGKPAVDPGWHFVREDGTRMPVEEYPVNRVLATHQALRDLVVGIDHGDAGERVWVLVHAFPEFRENHALRDVVVTFVEITQRKRAEEDTRRINAELEQRVRERTQQIEATNRELEAFGYSVSHDLRAPLRHIEGFSRRLAEEYGARLEGEGRHYLERVQAATRRMGDLIQDLLGLSRVTRQEMHVAAVDLSTLARAVAAELQKGEPGRRVAFVITPDLTARGDARLLRVALENLLDNAWKYTGKHATARIEFGAVERDGHLVYFVRDDGAGFDMAYASNLFAAFQRAHSASEFEGTGIGLATVQRIVHRHGGRVWAESAVERGATFYFTLGDPTS